MIRRAAFLSVGLLLYAFILSAQQARIQAIYTLKTVAWAVFPSPAVTPSRATAQKDQSKSVEDPDEYAVYDVLLNTKYFRKGLKRYVIAADTNSATKNAFIGWRAGLAPSGRKRPEVEPETSADFDAKNKESHRISEQFTLNLPYVVVTEEELKKIFRFNDKGNVDEESWNNFYKKYADTRGIFGFSRVGFNPKKDQALVYVTNQTGFTGGSGVFFVLSKGQNGWEVIDGVIMWLS